MAPLPENSTDRLFLDYTSRLVEHTMMLRVSASLITVPALAEAFANLFAARMFDDDSFYGARFSEAGSNFSLPVDFDPVVGTIDASSTSSWEQAPKAVFLSLPFRGVSTGRRGRVEFFTAVPTPDWPDDNRYNPGDAAVIDTLHENFEEQAEGGPPSGLVTIGGDAVTVYGYTNIAVSAYWQRKLRTS